MPIRTKLFLAVGSLILFFVAFSLLMNHQFLQDYYIWQKRANLLQSKNTVDKIYRGDPEAISYELDDLERNKGMNIYILDQGYQIKYNSSLRIFNFQGPDLPDTARRFTERLALLRPIEPRLNHLVPGDYLMNEVTDPRLQTNFLVLAARLSNREVLVLSTPLVAINESAAIANRFFLLTGLITVVVGGLAVYFFSRRFTRPILDLNEIALQMAHLDFSQKYFVRSNDEVGQLGRSINSLSDQLGQAIAELTEANERLKADIEYERRMEKMRKEFVSSVSHELKTPTALIQGYAEGLRLNVHQDEDNKNFYCDVIIDETGKMSNLIKELLELSQFESGQFHLEIAAFDISALVRHVLEKFRPILAERAIEPEVQAVEGVMVRGDMLRIEQVLMNFLNNALNHVNEQKSVRVTLDAGEDRVRVSVFNAGPAIPEEALDKIWTSFYKVDKARTRAYGGTGLGLSVVRAIMDLHQMPYGVYNTEGGVTFWFELTRDHEGETV